MIQTLEPRRLLSGSITGKLTHTGVLQVSGTTDADVLNIDIVNDRIQPGSSAVGYNGDTFLGIPFGTKVKRVRVDLSSGNDRLSIRSSVGTFVDGKAGKDKITIDARRAIVLGGSGNDTLQSIRELLDPAFGDSIPVDPEGNRTREPDTSFDVFLGSFNRLEGGPGNDLLYSRGGEDVLVGGSGFDRFIGASDDIRVFHSETFPLGRSAVVQRWESNCMVTQIEQMELREADRPVRAYF